MISVITPSIRPDMLQITKMALLSQTFQDFEWIPKVSLPRGHSDLCKQMNKALDEAKGDLIVFLQDAIKIPPEALERAWDNFQKEPTVGFTYPDGKTLDWSDVKWDWRSYWKDRESVTFDRFEIDFASLPRHALGNIRFDEDYDRGFGWENVQFAFELEKGRGVTFKVDSSISGIAYDHDAVMKHPWKDNPNSDLWLIKRGALEKLYESGNFNLEATRKTE